MLERAKADTSSRILLLAAAYFLTGKLGLLLAIPPGYATAIWPASGIAVAAVLLYGGQLWPGVLLGSFLVNVSIGYDPSDGLLDGHVIATAGAIGIGAALQALLARHLIRRLVGLPVALQRAREVLLCYFLAGPIACLVSATWGVGVLVSLGHIAMTELVFTWWTWWVGDTIGVFIVTPVVMCWLAQPYELWQARRRSVALPLLIALLVVIAVYFYASASEQQRLQVRFERIADGFHDAFRRNLERHLEILYAVRSFFDSSEAVTHAEFNTFVYRHLARNPGIHALSWNPVVAQSQREAFELAARREGLASFRITERNRAGELVGAATRDRHVVVRYIEPLETNRSALGFDVASHPDRRVALERAGDTGRPVVTPRITLVQETGNQAGVLVFLPVYDKLQSGTPSEPSRRVLRGYVTGVFRVGDMLHAAFKSMRFGQFDIRLDDRSAVASERLLQRYTTGVGPVFGETPSRPTAAMSRVFRFDDLGREWSLHIQASARQTKRQRGWEAWYVSAGGLLFTSMLGAFLLIMTGRSAELSVVNQRLRDEVGERKRAETEIRDREARLRSIYASAYEAIFLVDVERDQIIEFNPMALEMLEYSAEEMLQTPMSAIHPREMDKLRAFAAEVAERGGAVTDTLTCTSKYGKVIPAEISASSLSIDGRPLMLAMVRDISERKRTQAKLQEARDSLERRVDERTAELIAAKNELEVQRGRLEQMVEERTRELEGANDELRSFTSIVSHDMRAPLVNIGGFVTELRIAIDQLQAKFCSRFSPQLNDRQRDTLDQLLGDEVPTALAFIENSASRLDAKINAILRLSRLGYREFKPESIELGALVRGLLNDLAHQLEKTRTIPRIGELPTIVADRFAVEQILGNLLDNAVKYLDKDRPGEIAVSAQCATRETIVHVEDNGRGIAAADQAKIFKMFQRVGTLDKPGEGMGLAYVNSLVRRIGGRIWCESKSGGGSRFSVAFPKPSIDNATPANDANTAAIHDDA